MLLEGQIDDAGTLNTDVVRKTFDTAHNRQFSARIYNLTKTDLSTNIYVTDRNGLVLYDSNGGAAEGLSYADRRDVQRTLSGLYGARSTRTNEADDRSSIMFVGAALRHQGRIVGMLSVSKPQRSMFAFVEETRARIQTTSFFFFSLVACGALLVAVVFARPIRQLTDYARAIARGQRTRLPRFGAPELRTLANAFEEMRDALENRKYVESYVQSLTHEMKSPVAAIRGAAELLGEEMPLQTRKKFVGNIQAESTRLQKIIDRLLALAAIESRKTLEQPEPVSLAEFVRSVGAQMQPAAEARQLRLLVQIASDPVVQGEPFLLEIALTNLIQNAIEFSNSGGTITMALQTDNHNRRALLTISDQGCGIPEFALERIFERFYSLQHPSTGRKSSGLGLCFVREAAELHGGQITIVNRTGEPGVQATLNLPLAP